MLAAPSARTAKSSQTTTATTDTTATSGSASGTLTGSVGPGFDISMGQSTVAAGTYALTVDDQSSSHDFHLTGDGVDVLLCWLEGDRALDWYHRADLGFAGRRRLPGPGDSPASLPW